MVDSCLRLIRYFPFYEKGTFIESFFLTHFTTIYLYNDGMSEIESTIEKKN